MATREIWEKEYRPHLLDLDLERIKVQELRHRLTTERAMGKWVGFGTMSLWELARQSMGDITLYESLLLDPGWIHDYNRVYTDFFKTHYAYIFEKVGTPDCIWFYDDLGFKNGLFASPKTLGELLFPYYAELVDFYHDYDVPVVLHTCGSTADALPLIVEAGFDAVNPIERKAVKNDPFAFAKAYGDKLAFLGAFDMRVLESNDKALIRREVAGLIEGMKARGARFVFSPDHGITPRVRYDSWVHAVQVYREHMWY
jgi:uroporphyrinogen decarboxylase